MNAPEQRILAAAREVFLEKGLEGARMQEIARRAGLNKALLHYYFRSKKRLFEMVLTQEIRHFFEGLFAAIPTEGDFVRFLRSFIHAYLKRLAQNPAIIRFLLWELEKGAETVDTALSRIAGEVFQKNIVLQRIQQAVRSGEIRAVDPIHFLMSVIGMCIYPFLARPIWKYLLPDVAIDSSEFLQKREQEIFQLIWNGVKP